MRLEPDHEDIHTAARNGDTDEVAALLSMDNRLAGTHDADGWTPLHLAAHHGHAATVEVLLHNNAPVDIRSDNQLANTPLHAALAGKRGEAVRILVEAGADVDAKQHGGWTPLHQSMAAGDRPLTELLLSRKAVPTANDAGVPPSAIARERGHTELADWLDGRAAGR